ncbi:unnamed protein product [Rotaria sp. Silwood2]|nr:unnamed protein product [Rotaria sp. Silwood2]CAF3109681.1 unnamed protein product [Rotaria sp. Silwood2]CAF3304291.1 unnamed protein product [Rotaria sp. Silwood2]CAF3422787.1 unnamed protein product [Rotaria sp. Silwood2]CAF4202697.1 unnamed protein product [Rotaria sp. Silwood2]
MKKKINVSLNGTDFGEESQPEVDLPFQSTLVGFIVYTNRDGESVDLLQLYGVRTHLGRFAALVMDTLFTKEELTSITKDELVKDDRYLIIKG